VLHVELDDPQVVALVRELGEHGLHRPARRTPGRREVDEHRPVGLEDLGGEAVVVDRGKHRHRASVAPRGRGGQSHP